MYEFHPYFTNDGSVGLYSPAADDIYHSTYGALSEAYEKFVLPADLENYFINNNEIKVLDICYGIGYNTKSFLNFLIEKNIINLKIKKEKNKKFFNQKNTNIAQIYTNNNSTNKNNGEIYGDNIECNDKLYSNNNSGENNKNYTSESKKCNTINNCALYSNNISADNSVPFTQNKKIFIKALDTDEKLFYLSPFFRQGCKKDKKYNKIDFDYDKISKLLNNDFARKYSIKEEVNLIIFRNIIEKMPEIFEDKDFFQVLTSPKYSRYFDRKFTAFFKALKFSNSNLYPDGGLCTFLHNIYYKYISLRYKKAVNSLILDDFIFEPVRGDARTSLLHDKNTYNFIFLDAFTPAKCPSLWSLEFFKLLFDHLDDNGMILTYSNSAAVRSAIINAGFFAGKIYNQEARKYTGTVAVKNKALIKHELSEYDLGLLNSKAGIFYRDKNLDATNEAIIASHKKECETSGKISSSAFIKGFRKKT